MSEPKKTHPLAISTWGAEEREAILKVLDSGNFTMGEKVKEFETAYADWINAKYAVMVNSGSSANLLMVAAFTLRYGESTVIVPAVSWSTSYSPFQQYGWELKFVDIDRETLNYDLKKLHETYTGKELILAVNLMGNPNDYKFFPNHAILEDNCESMGAEYEGMRTGNFGIMSSHSMFFSHHMQTMEGGIITTDDEYFYHMLLCLRSHGWTRHLPEKNVFNVKPSAYEFLFPGYNVRPLEMMGAVGVEQLKKLDGFISQRRENAEKWKEVCRKRGWMTQKEIGKSSWFALPLVAEDIIEVKKELDAKGIEHRPIVAGNFTRSKSIEHYEAEIPSLPNADYIHDHGLYIGNHHQPLGFDLC